MLVVLVAFAAPFALALGASRLRSVAGLAALAIAAYAGSAADPRTAVLAAAAGRRWRSCRPTRCGCAAGAYR